jgi:predicted deacylase
MRIAGESPRFEALGMAQQVSAPAPGVRAEAGSFLKALASVGRAVDRGEALAAQASHGQLGGLDSAQLIALQAGIYRYSEAVDLVAKLVDRTSTAVRTVISPH